jgi:hypothetical protein
MFNGTMKNDTTRLMYVDREKFQGKRMKKIAYGG